MTSADIVVLAMTSREPVITTDWTEVALTEALAAHLP